MVTARFHPSDTTLSGVIALGSPQASRKRHAKLLFIWSVASPHEVTQSVHLSPPPLFLSSHLAASLPKRYDLAGPLLFGVHSVRQNNSKLEINQTYCASKTILVIIPAIGSGQQQFCGLVCGQSLQNGWET